MPFTRARTTCPGTVSVVAELRESVAAGDIGQAFVSTARRIARSVLVMHFQGPQPSDDDVDDLVNEMVVRATPAKIVMAAADAANDAAFRAWLRKATISALNQAARATQPGRVLRAIQDALREDSVQFLHNDHHWALVGDGRSASWAEGDQRLHECAHGVEVGSPSPAEAAQLVLGQRGDVRRVALAVLELSGPLPEVQLGEVVAKRFGKPFRDLIEYVDPTNAAYQAEAPDASPIDAMALAVLAKLTVEEGQALGAYLRSGSIRGIAEQLGWRKHRVEAVQKRLHARLAQLSGDLDEQDRQAVINRVLEFVGQAFASRHSSEGWAEP